MKFGIYDINLNTNFDFKDRLEIYKNAGFCSLGLYIDDAYMKPGESFEEIITYAKLIGLEVAQVHADYKISNSLCDSQSNLYFDYLTSRLEICKKHGIANLVLHASKGDNPPIASSTQLAKLEAVANQFPEINLCFENVRNNINLQNILKLNVPNIKMCYDMGHAHCYSNEFSLLDDNLSKIACTHLSNNLKKDTHNLLSDGEIDYVKILRKLKRFPKINNCLEVFPPFGVILSDDEFKAFVYTAFSAVSEF